MAGNQILIPMLISFGLSVLLGPVVIPFLKRLKVGQMVREDGPYTHLKKSGTPTMGGILILVSVAVTTVLYVGRYPKILPVFFLTLGFGLIGFFDDYLKIVKRNSVGLRPWQKMLGQILVTGMFAWYLSYTGNIPQAMRIPFMEGRYLRLGALEIPFLFLVVTGTANGTNFTDGLDGLVSSVTVMVATFFTVVSMGMGAGIEPLTCAVAGALLGFLLFNVHPASVFMGDTGSLALGGFVAGCAYMMQMPLFLPIVGLIYVAEVLSVIIQVVYFKVSGGKRFFKMAPLHHHFELCGFSETKVVAVFSIITAVLCVLALLGI
ncbi:MAG: phospho-N-acetylmuramoyl-pentapeptide-transferase [Lachnospiraceae bacterium]|nr:phospho-N-acetylmuramoyl-pentapeptide-transferase [Lachnospiraceae bacterium]MDE7008601.1 phospho-N-acetylmuramoyl-pentapeptide-transferase [Lachnospiraceae bacterium]